MAIRLREAVRALVVDEHGEIMLVRYEFPTATIWGLPGGGLEPGEDRGQALRRELEEELGLREIVIGPHIWTREQVIPMHTGHDGQRDRVFLVHTDRFDPQPTIGWNALRAEFVHELRWWSIDAIEAGVASGTLFAPRRLADLARATLTDGPPAEPIETGI
jgi:8-oxo-dGTP pyrophosphatase MutT (NUDIX family)